MKALELKTSINLKERKIQMSTQINVIMGPTFSGKTTSLQEILKAHPEYHRVITTTTRPPRINEHNGQDYFFVTNRQALLDYDEKIQIAQRSYQVATNETWTYYLSAKSLQHLAPVNFLIIDYKGYLELEAYILNHPDLDINLHGYLLDTNLRVIFQRIANSSRHNEDPKETLRRLYDDTFNAFNLSNHAMKVHHIQKISAQDLINQFK